MEEQMCTAIRHFHKTKVRKKTRIVGRTSGCQNSFNTYNVCDRGNMATEDLRPISKRKGNIKINIIEIRCEAVQ
jgi:hypothetical protein